MKQASEVYRYDGSWQGFLCCVFTCFERREVPADIQGDEGAQQSLYPVRRIATDASRAGRVEGWIRNTLGGEVRELACEGFLSSLPQREMHIVRLLLLARQLGPLAASAHGDRSVSALRAAVYSMHQEAHLLTGFIRFVEHQGVLTATISPKHQVLHRLGPHFSGRFSGERIVIYDDTHERVLWCQAGRWGIVRASVQFPPPDGAEEQWRQLWKRFYRTIGIEGRENPRCRMTHMPKRYWKHMTEMEDEIGQATPAALSTNAGQPFLRPAGGYGTIKYPHSGNQREKEDAR